MSNAELLETAETLQNLLLTQVRGSNETAVRDNLDYKELRTSLIQYQDVQPLLPRFIRTCRDLMQFWGYIKSSYKHYDEREAFVREQFAPLLDDLEAKTLAKKNGANTVSVNPNLPDTSTSLVEVQISDGVNSSSGGNTNIQGDVVGRDKIISNTNITNNYFPQDTISQSQRLRSPFNNKSNLVIIDVAAVIGSHFRHLETFLGGPAEVVQLGIGATEKVPDGGESRTYKTAKYSICVTYDKEGLAKGFQIIDGLLENGYSLEHWPLILSKLGMTVVNSPDVTAPAARRWNNYVGYGIMIVANRPYGNVWTARVFKLPD